MHIQPHANVIRIKSKQGAQLTQPVPALELTHAQIRQQLSMQLQSSLDLATVLEMFFNISQAMIRYDSLAFESTQHDLSVALYAPRAHRVTYSLNHQDERLGDITFSRARRFSEKELGDFESIMAALILPLRNTLLYSIALQNALKDPLTGIGNRSAMQQMLERESAAAQHHKQPLAVIMIDIDYFKRINDSYGHSAGDAVLLEVTAAIQAQLRRSDALFRYGGEEFLAILPNTCSAAAQSIAERLRKKIEALSILYQLEVIKVTASFGCATLLSDASVQKLLQRSDAALYAAKHQGRNQVQLAPEVLATRCSL